MNTKNDELILNHYKKVAEKNGFAPTSSMEDQYIRQSEVDFFLSEISFFVKEKGECLNVLDVGCGNGYLLSLIREKFSALNLWGLEFTPELFDLAQKRNLCNTTIIHGDCRKEQYFTTLPDMDIIITERAVINILTKNEQEITLLNILKKLSFGGSYLLSESFEGPLEELNQACQEMGVKEVSQSYQNLYLGEWIVPFLLSNNVHEERPKEYSNNFLSTHFYLTRVFHKAIRKEGTKVKFTRFCDFFREALPPAIGNYSPILFRVFKKS